MEKKLIEIWNTLRKASDEIIQRENHITQMCFTIDKSYKITAMALIWDSADSKEFFKQKLKNILVNQDILGYILFFDVKMTIIKENKTEVKDAVVRQFYTPNEKLIESVIYKNKKIIKVMDMNKCDNYESDWNLWGKSIDQDSEINKKYQQYKKDNPEKYKEVM